MLVDIELPRDVRLRERLHGNLNALQYLVLDNFLPHNQAESLLDEILRFGGQRKKSSDYIFAINKYEDPAFQNYGPTSQAYHDLLLSSQFSSWLSFLTGESLTVDPSFLGGGLHLGGPGSCLDMHVDFEQHPSNKSMLRHLNILLYLNPGWQPTYGGQLDIQHRLTRASVSIEPFFNRLVIMRTDCNSIHGYEPISFPDGSFRISLAAYAYRTATGNSDLTRRTTTRWYSKRTLIHRLLAPHIHKLVTIKTSLFGSSTKSRSEE